MTALTKDRATRTRASAAARRGVGDLAADAVIYCGALIAKNAAGNIVPADDAAALKVVGIAEAFADNTDGSAGDVTVPYMTGLIVELENDGGTIVQAGKHEPCYVADDQSVTTAAAATNDILAGLVVEFTTTKVWVYVDEILESAVLATPLDGADVQTLANGGVSPAELTGGIPVVFVIDIPNAATATYSYKTAEKIEIIDVWNIKDGAGAANTIQVTDGSDVAITNAMAAAVDKTKTNASTIDKATRVLAAGATFKVVATRAAGTMAAQLFILAIKRA
ncbi:MAG TPA: hypothetical protein VN253_30240 [Kofleriaceae bacterium]|nr:hypothetical protein [Kofleriaceae bacterium]